MSGTVTSIEPSGPVFLAGASFAVAHINCQFCEQDFPYRKAASGLGSIGYRVNRRAIVAGEVFRIPIDTESGRLRTWHVDVVAQYRPWAARGLFVKGGAGMAFVRNWIDVAGTAPVTSKALSIVMGAGWEFRPAARVGYQFLATQHATALGDVQTSLGEAQNVLGNFWSIGAALVIR
ncbi:MAG: hypothetical protein AB7G23_16845 [Vicinamibacterales bacterium]